MPREEKINRLRKLKAATDDAIGRIESAGGCDGAINWADLSCRQAMHIIDDDGTEWDEVLIEEASPDSSTNDFRGLVHIELEAAGWLSVAIRTEW